MKIIDRKFLNTVTKTCHASTLTYYKDKPIFAWFGGEKEGLPDSAIYIQNGNEGILHTIGTNDMVTRWNPILFTHNDNIYLFTKAGEFCDRWQTSLFQISDLINGQNIRQLPCQLIPAGLNGPVKTKPIIDEVTGLMYCGSSVETRQDWTAYIEVFSLASDGSLKFEYRTKPLTVPKVEYNTMYGTKRLSAGIIQPSLWVDSERQIHAFFRSSTGLGKVYYSSSKLVEDNSFNDFEWTTPRAIEHLDNPNSGVDTMFYKDKLYLVYNPDQTYRNPLLLVELDYKDNFKIIDTLEITKEILPEEHTYTLELSYPYLIENKGNLELTYTYGRSKIEHVRIEI